MIDSSKKVNTKETFLSFLLEVRNLRTSFSGDDGRMVVVDDVSFKVEAWKTLGIVVESGCGKSISAMSIMRLIQPPGEIEFGEILFKNRDLLKLPEEEMRKIRGQEIAMIFQEPMSSLNPVFTCGDQIEEVIRLHKTNLTSKQIREKTIEMFKKVGIPSPEQRIDEYPHQLSGGMRQRVMIAMAMSCNPSLLIADEPTTALDVTIQAQILDLMRKLQREFQAGTILITHDLGVVAEMCHEIVIMYAGKIVEVGSVEDIFYRHQHPYTKGLLDSIPRFETGKKMQKLNTIPGLVPNLRNLPKGCRFYDRCFKAQADCTTKMPDLNPLEPNQEPNQEPNHSVACYHPLQRSGGNL